jgi:hypothetical protein
MEREAEFGSDICVHCDRDKWREANRLSICSYLRAEQTIARLHIIIGKLDEILKGGV